MKRSQRLPLCLFAAWFAWPALAFVVDIHRAITAEALKTFLFSATAIAEVQNANECVDTGPSIYSADDKDDLPCQPNLASIDQQLGAPEDHFDDEQFLVGIAQVRAKKTQILMMINQGRYTQARKLLGAATHGIQDFYAHSNWVELGNQSIFTGLESGTVPMSFNPAGNNDKGPIRLAGEGEDVCQFKVEQQYDRVTGGIAATKTVSPEFLPKAAKGGNVLTSGFFFAQIPYNAAKCRHGAIFDGINKDTPTTLHGKEFHTIARRLAKEHTIAFVKDILSQLNGDEKAIKGLTKAITRVEANRVNSTGLTVKQGDQYRFTTSATPPIVWGRESVFLGKPLTSGPEGVDAHGYIGYVTPPVPDKGVGALILEVRPALGCVTDPGSPTTARTGGTQCPSRYLYIGKGADITMPIDGELFLLVNDSYLGNNSGHFETEVMLLQKAK